MTNSMYSSYTQGILDPQVKEFLEQLSKSNSPPLASLKPEYLRKNSDLLHYTKAMSPVEKIENIMIPGPGCSLPLRIYTPYGSGQFPILIYFHGGGWVFGNLDEADCICSTIANGASCIVVSVDYRLSPENKYPAAVEDAYAASLWTAMNAKKIGGDSSRIAIAGESAGANLATVTSLRFRENGYSSLIYQVLICPVTNLSSFDTDSYRYFGKGIWLSKANIEYYYNHYLDKPESVFDPYASPILAKDLSGLPPAHIILAEFDVLRDEGEAYAKRLLDSGVDVTSTLYKGMIHSFPILNKVFDKAGEAIDECVIKLRNAFNINRCQGDGRPCEK